MKRVVPFFVILSVVLLGVSWVVFAAPAGAPLKLSVTVGGFDGPSYRVTLLAGGKVEYVAGGGNFVGAKTETVAVSAEQWRQFRADVDKLGIWKWQPSYESLALDGTQWAVEIHYLDARLDAKGSNSYPGKAGKASSSLKMTAEFKSFLTAVEKLLGSGRPFG
jgi:hypothetical protein